ncbi:DUF167 domain-containing protein [Microbacterium laevaniformans]|uniref:DUF167 domain-containing protein n=1 Tax=Microbacterium laevaniformans TaxID=36807 RepID=A0A4V3RKA9_9MICO|nr:DUF167 domain-containing protein [Microbacterium laevaniformans]TGY39110.1 DUF167 domain-containing protein [Microbacterium laevaniformans]
MQFSVHVKPGSRKGPLVEQDAEGLTVFVRERAVDGAANDAVTRVLADHFGVAPRDVTILRGHASRHKCVEVDA